LADDLEEIGPQSAGKHSRQNSKQLDQLITARLQAGHPSSSRRRRHQHYPRLVRPRLERVRVGDNLGCDLFAYHEFLMGVIPQCVGKKIL
jgi:hypothetical protein